MKKIEKGKVIVVVSVENQDTLMFYIYLSGLRTLSLKLVQSWSNRDNPNWNIWSTYENSYLLRLKMMLMRVVRPNQNSNIASCESKTLPVELRETAR